MSRSERARYTRTPASWVAGCSDVGRRHSTNQDAMSMAVRDGSPVAMLAVADGVSSAAGSELASLVAADTAVNTLVAKHREAVASNLAFVAAFAEANRAVVEAPAEGEPSACTLIAAQIDGADIALGNAGDSRAYWLGDDGSCLLLSTDDSMAQAHIQMGMSRDDAESGQHAHAITKWLGRRASDVTPTVTVHRATADGWLLLCSDGLWNYASSPESMREVFTSQAAHAVEPVALAERLVDWANEAGGRDNITVVLARITIGTTR